MKKRLKDFFIPHEGNGYRPHSLEKAAMLGMLFLVMLSFTIANLQSFVWLSSEWMISTIFPAVIVDLTNGERETGDLTNLQRSTVLDQAAQMKAEHMASHQYFSHYSPDGVSPWHWFSEAEYAFVHAGENLAIHFADSSEVVEAWMDSPTHRANIMNGDFTEIGIGTAEGYFEGFKTVYVVQLFGTPAREVPEPSVQEFVAAVEEEVVPTETDIVSVPKESVVAVVEEVSPPNLQIAGSDEVVETLEDTTVTLSSERDPVVLTPTTSKEIVPTTTEIVEVATTEESVSLYSDHMSTSTGGIPANIETTTIAGSTGETAGVAGILTRPQLVLQIVYTIIAFFVVIVLAFALFIEIRRQHPIHVAYSAGLSAAMLLLFYLHLTLTSGAVII